MMEEKRKSYRPEIKDERVGKMVRLGDLDFGEVFIICDDLHMVIGGGTFDAALQESFSSFEWVRVVNLSNGRWHRMDGNALVHPVKTTITIN